MPWFEAMLPRQLEIIYEINRRFLGQVRAKYPGDDARVARVSLIEEGEPKKMLYGAHGDRRLAQHERRRGHSYGIAEADGCTGIRRVVSGAVQQQDQRSDAATFPSAANPALAKVHHRCHRRRLDCGPGQLEKLKPLAKDKAFRDRVRQAKREAKARFPTGSSQPRTGGRPRSQHDFRHPDQAHPRIQAAAPERTPHRDAIQPPAREPQARHSRGAPFSSAARPRPPTFSPSS